MSEAPGPWPRLLGILNVTPDSFSDGGADASPADAVARGVRLHHDGAAFVDVGGESTRPGAAPVALDEERRRVLPVVEGLVGRGVPVSIDTRRARVMAEAVAAGASMVNDVSALRDPGALEAVAAARVPVVLMHMAGEPATMQAAPRYRDVLTEVEAFLLQRALAAMAAGVARAAIILDPGLGFGKTIDHNLALLRGLPRLAAHGFPLMLGASRKSLIGAVDRPAPPAARLGGSLALALHGAAAGAAWLRVHDVAATRQALAVAAALGSPPPPCRPI